MPVHVRPLHLVRGLALAAAALALALPAHAQFGGRGEPKTFKPGPGPDELWEITFSVEMPGMSMPPTTSQACQKKGSKDADLVPASDECTMTDLKTSGNRTTFSMTCRGDPPMSGTGDITSGPNEYKGRITARSTRRGQEMTMTQVFSGRKIGTCTDLSEQIIAKAEADGKAQIAKACAEGLETLNAALFDAQAPCAAQRKQFCDRTAGVAGGMREPAGHSAARSKYGGFLQGALKLCAQDYVVLTRAACGKAVETRNWNFVGNGQCDADVRAQAPKYCNTGPNRSPDRQYFGLCGRYAQLTRGTATAGGDGGAGPGGGGAPAPGGTAAGPAAGAAGPSAPPQPDPIKSGVDAVRRLLPF